MSALNLCVVVAWSEESSRSAVVFALQNWLAETPEQKQNATTPSYLSVGMSCAYIFDITHPLGYLAKLNRHQ